MTKKNIKNFHYTDHLANERTFLAWMRTNLGLMAFGFVIEKFSFFMKQMADFLGMTGVHTMPSPLQGFSSVFGISLVGIGAVLCALAYLKFKRTERHINEDVYEFSPLLNACIAICIFAIGFFLIVYLISSHHAIG